jgi:DNA-binding transcriptional MerR regulator
MSLQLKIGEVAKGAGVRVDTVRFYEREGLLPRASRSRSGYRMFTTATVERVAFVKRAQALGFTLEEIADILRSIERGEVDYANGRTRLLRVLARIDAKVTELQAVRRELVAVLDRFETGHCDEIEQTAKRIKNAGSRS